MRACYIRCPDLEELWREARERPGGERKATRKYAAFQVLVLDEWLLDRPGELFRGFLLELMEARYGTASTVFCTQFRQKDWHARLGGGVHADAIMDRIVHGAAWVNMGEMNMRRKLGGRFRIGRASPVPIEDAGGIDSRCRRYQIAISDGIKRGKYSPNQR